MAAKFLKRDNILYSESVSIIAVGILCDDNVLVVGSVIGDEEA